MAGERTTATGGERICVGAVTGARGLKGELRVKSFTADPDDLFAYGPLSDESGTRQFTGRVSGHAKDHLLVFIDGIGDRTRADGMKGTRFYIDRGVLPPPEEDEFYHADLIGLAAELTDGTELGPVKGVIDVGGGSSIEVLTGRGPLLVPFTRAAVPVVDIEGGRLVIDPPDGLMDDEPEDDGGEEEEADER